MKKYINIGILIIWMIVIFMLSNDSGTQSSQKSDTLAVMIVEKINLITGNKLSTNSKEYIENMIFFVRKSAHFIEYFILGIFTFNVLKDYKKIKYSIILLGILFCFIYATSDEIHQLFIVGRSCKYLDILIDTVGSSSGILTYYYFYKIKVLSTR